MIEHSPKVLASEGKTTTTTTSSRKHLPLKRLASHWENHEWQWYVIQNGSSTQADYRKYLSPEILSIPYKWFAPQTPPKKTKTTTTEKSGKTFKQRPSKGTYPGWIQRKISRSVFHNMQITSEPLCSHPCTRLKIQIPMHSISWGCPKIVRHCDPISLLINTFDIHLEPGCKSHEQIIYYHAAKKCPKTNEFCSIIRRFLLNWPGRDFL